MVQIINDLNHPLDQSSHDLIISKQCLHSHNQTWASLSTWVLVNLIKLSQNINNLLTLSGGYNLSVFVKTCKSLLEWHKALVMDISGFLECRQQTARGGRTFEDHFQFRFIRACLEGPGVNSWI